MMNSSITNLLDGHDAIMRSARLLLVAVDGERFVPARAAARLATLAATIAVHVSQETDFVYVVEDHRQNEEATAEFAEQLTELAADWDDYLADWPMPNIAAHPTVFIHDTRSIVRRVLDRVDRENQYLYPQALRMSAISLC